MKPDIDFELRTLHRHATTALPYEDWVRQALTDYEKRHPLLPAKHNDGLFLIWVRIFLVPLAVTPSPTIH